MIFNLDVVGVFVFCHCDKISENINLKRKRFVLGCYFKGFGSLPAGSKAETACQKGLEEESPHAMATRKHSGRVVCERWREEGVRDKIQATSSHLHETLPSSRPYRQSLHHLPKMLSSHKSTNVFVHS